jgi:hypothetical protein
VTVSNAVSVRRKGAELYALMETGEVYRSLDYGRSWLPVGTITASNMRAIVENGTVILAAAETSEVYGSPDGAAWSALGTINQLRLISLGSDSPQVTGVRSEEAPPRIQLRTPYPNPTSPQVGSTFLFGTGRTERIRLGLYDVRGSLLASVELTASEAATEASFHWKPTGVPAGTYLVRAVAESGATASLKWSFLD